MPKILDTPQQEYGNINGLKYLRSKAAAVKYCEIILNG